MDTPAILLVIELHAPSPPCLARALMLTRYLHARLDILVYPQLSIPGLSPGVVRQRQEEAGECVAALRRSIVAPDVEITIELASGGPMSDAIVDKARQNHYALIIKAPWQQVRSRRDPNDWQLMRRCPVPLLLTAGRPWHPKARFLAVIDVLNPRGVGQREAILEAANALRLACAAELDLGHIEPANSHDPAQDAGAARMQLERLGQRYDLAASRLHQLGGRTTEPLRLFVSEREYDLLIVGVANEIQAPWPPSIGPALAQSLSATDCDLLMIQESEKVQSVLTGQRLLRWSPFPLWQWLGTD